MFDVSCLEESLVNENAKTPEGKAKTEQQKPNTQATNAQPSSTQTQTKTQTETQTQTQTETETQAQTETQTQTQTQTQAQTKKSPPEKPWSNLQDLAMQLIVSGMKIKEAAERVGVDRRTINRWMKHPRFQQGMEERKQLLRGALRGQLAAMVKSAFDALSDAVDRDDHRTALGLLKSMKVLDGSPLSESEAAYLKETPETETPHADEGDAAEEVATASATATATAKTQAATDSAVERETEKTLEQETEKPAEQRRGQTGHSAEKTDAETETEATAGEDGTTEAAETVEETNEPVEPIRIVGDFDRESARQAWAKTQAGMKRGMAKNKASEEAARREERREREWIGNFEREQAENHRQDATGRRGQTGHSAEISPVQRQILDGLEEGKSLAEATHEVGISVAMLQDWLRQEPAFRAAIEEDRLQMESYWELRGLMLGYQAAACVQRKLNAGHGGVALEVLKGLRVV